LLSAIPVPMPGQKKERIMLEGDVPSAIDPPEGCRFHTRCPFAVERCRSEVPELRPVAGAGEGHLCACHFFEEIFLSDTGNAV